MRPAQPGEVHKGYFIDPFATVEECYAERKAHAQGDDRATFSRWVFALACWPGSSRFGRWYIPVNVGKTDSTSPWAIEQAPEGG